jgi:hypothetical protein
MPKALNLPKNPKTVCFTSKKERPALTRAGFFAAEDKRIFCWT